MHAVRNHIALSCIALHCPEVSLLYVALIIEEDLGKIDWVPMESLSRTDPDGALSLFHQKVLSVIETHVPTKKTRVGKFRSKIHRMRRLLWRKLHKVDTKL